MSRFEADITVYVPVYKVNLDSKDFPYYPTYQFAFAEAHTDEQMIASLEPDEILKLTGNYNWSTKMSKFKIGDRVRVYHTPQWFTGTIIEVKDNGCVHVTEKYPGACLSHPDGPFHAEQCRKLKPKTKITHLPGDLLEDGYIYVGISYDEKKKQFYHLAMAPEDVKDSYNWSNAMIRFSDSLPTNKEQSLIQGALPLELLPKKEYYWSSTEFSNNSAWVERFSDGYQTNAGKSSTYVVRCVRRFNYFKRKK